MPHGSEMALIGQWHRVPIALALIVTPVAASAALTINEKYVRTSPGEVIGVSGAAPSGGTSIATYSGLVEVVVSGIVYAAPGYQPQDAFYTRGNPSDLLAHGYYQMNLGRLGVPLGPFQPTRSLRKAVVFGEGVGDLVLGTRPPYNPDDSTYHFVIDVGDIADRLMFNYSDGNYTDNSGSYSVALWQAALRPAGGVPEPSSWAMLITGFGIVGAVARRRRKGMAAAC